MSDSIRQTKRTLALPTTTTNDLPASYGSARQAAIGSQPSASGSTKHTEQSAHTSSDRVVTMSNPGRRGSGARSTSAETRSPARRLLRATLLIGLVGALSSCAAPAGSPPSAPPPPAESSMTTSTPSEQAAGSATPTPDASGGTYGTAEDPAQLPPAPPAGALEPITSAGVTYLLSAAGDRDAIAHPARFWIDDHACLRVDVDDATGYFAVLDPTVVVTSDDIVDSAGTRHAFDAVTTVGSQAVPRSEVPDAFQAQCGAVSADQLWGAGL